MKKFLIVLSVLTLLFSCEGMQGKKLNKEQMAKATDALEIAVSKSAQAIVANQKFPSRGGNANVAIELPKDSIPGLAVSGKASFKGSVEDLNGEYSYDMLVKFKDFGFETDIDGEKNVSVKINGTIKMKYKFKFDLSNPAAKYDFEIAGRALSIKLNDKILEPGKIYFYLKLAVDASINLEDGIKAKGKNEFRINGSKFEGIEVAKNFKFNISSFFPKKQD